MLTAKVKELNLEKSSDFVNVIQIVLANWINWFTEKIWLKIIIRLLTCSKYWFHLKSVFCNFIIHLHPTKKSAEYSSGIYLLCFIKEINSYKWGNDESTNIWTIPCWIKWKLSHFLFTQTLSVSMLLRYSHHQIFVFIGKFPSASLVFISEKPFIIKSVMQSKAIIFNKTISLRFGFSKWTFSRCWRWIWPLPSLPPLSSLSSWLLWVGTGHCWGL